MSPDSDAIKWITIAAALVQAIAAVIQVAQGRGRPAETRVMDGSIRKGFLAIVLGVVWHFLTIYLVRNYQPDEDLPIILGLAWISLAFAAFYVGAFAAWENAKILVDDEKRLDAAQVVSHSLALLASAMILLTILIRFTQPSFN